MEEINWCQIPERYVLHTVRKNRVGKWESESFDATTLEELLQVFKDFEEIINRDALKSSKDPVRGTDYEFGVFSRSHEIEDGMRLKIKEE